MDDDRAFLRAIHERPDDDLPRLIYADYLDERGESARAEFIRVGCARARLMTDELQSRRLVETELALLSENLDEWEQPFPGALSIRFDRGFASVIEMEASAFVAGYQRFRDLCPDAEFHLRNTWEEINALVRLELPVGVRTLNLSENRLIDAEIQKLLTARWLPELVGLNLCRNGLTASAVRTLARTPGITGLRLIDLSDNLIGCDGAAALAQSSVLPNLRTLGLRRTGLRFDGIAALARGPGLAGVESLDLRGNELNTQAVNALWTGPNSAHWTSLTLGPEDLSFENRELLTLRFGRVLRFRS